MIPFHIVVYFEENMSMRIQLRLTAALVAASYVLTPSPAAAVLPLPPQVGCGEGGDISNCPNEVRRDDGTLEPGAWSYLNFTPTEFRKVNQAEVGMGTGSHTTLAWQTTAGRFDVPIAILDCGIRWQRGGVANKVWLNFGELPPARNSSGAICSGPGGQGDCDGNGLKTVSDYASDSRVPDTAGDDIADDRLDGSDLIAVFSDGIDGDHNGYIDDIGGWDFMWDDNDPHASTDFYHGTSVMEEAAAEGGDEGDIGHCPNCSILPIRISDSFIGEGNKIAAGIVYAVDRGAKVIGMALGSMTNPEALQDAMLYAWDHDVTIVAAAGDEMGYHHNFPAANDYALYTHSIKYWPPIEPERAQSFLGFFGCNNFGARLDLVGSSDACATGSVAAISGIVGLVWSRSVELGLNLSASEMRQVMIHSADDVAVRGSTLDHSPYFPSRPGWDFFFGYGRANTARAIALLSPYTIPPEVEVQSPKWFQYIDPATQSTLNITGSVGAPRSSSYGYKIEWAPGAEPTDDEWTVFVNRSNILGQLNGTLGTLDLAAIPASVFDASDDVEPGTFRDTLQSKIDKVNAHAITIRVEVTDADGNVGEMRRQFFLRRDSTLMPGFPVKLGESGDSSPTLYDMDGDGDLEIVLGTSGGDIHVFRADGRELPGWPARLEVFPTMDAHDTSPGWTSGELNRDVAEGIIGSVAVGDLEGDGYPEVVASSLDGQVYVFDHLGDLRPGFPVERDFASDDETDALIWRDPGMFASPVLFDLDNDGLLEIIQASMDQKVYIWREDGERQPGWPVLLDDVEEVTRMGRIVSSPAVGDIDGDGAFEIVVGSNEYEDEATWWGYAYALRAGGELEPGGPIQPGWPIQIVGALNGVIMYIGEGVSPSPGLADVDGDGADEIALSGVVGVPALYSGNGRMFKQLSKSKVQNSRASNADTGFWPVVSNPAFGDIDSDGDLDVTMVGSGLNYLITLGASTKLNFAHLTAAWDTNAGKMLEGFPTFMEDISFFLAPAIADVTGDGKPEVMAGTSGYLLHAFDATGNEAPGFPKQTGGWMIASPTVGDLDGDGSNEVVQVTREGYLFAWTTPGRANVEPEWGSFRHDPQNTGNYGTVVDRGM